MHHKEERIEYDHWTTCDICERVTGFKKQCAGCSKDLCSECARKRYIGTVHDSGSPTVEDSATSYSGYWYFCGKCSKGFKSPKAEYPDVDPSTRNR